MATPTGLVATLVNPFGEELPDDDSLKLIELQAAGRCQGAERHVLLRWTNGQRGQTNYTQLIHLTGGPGKYAFFKVSVKPHSEASRRLNTFYPLGVYTRAQRDQIIDIATSIAFDKNSGVNDCCVWMRDLLEAMVAVGLLHKATLDKVVSEIPLKKRVPEVPRS